MREGDRGWRGGKVLPALGGESEKGRKEQAWGAIAAEEGEIEGEIRRESDRGRETDRETEGE